MKLHEMLTEHFSNIDVAQKLEMAVSMNDPDGWVVTDTQATPGVGNGGASDKKAPPSPGK